MGYTSFQHERFTISVAHASVERMYACGLWLCVYLSATNCHA